MHRVVVLTGHSRVGKTSLAEALERRFQFYRMKTSTIVKKQAIKRRLAHDRKGLQKFGDILDEEVGHDWVFRYVKDLCSVMNANGHADRSIVIDSIRTWEQLKPFRQADCFHLIHVHLFASRDEILRRANTRYGDETAVEENDIIKRRSDIELFRNDADIRINTDNSDTDDTLVRVIAQLGLLPPPDRRLVDLIIGGQYGSEGKGHVAAYLAPEYDVLMRVGGPNAGHTVSGNEGLYTYHQLPSGTKDTDAEILIGPGATLYVPELLREIRECGVDEDRLYIDPQAMIISDEDRQNEGRLRADISSTASGSGFAASRRIIGRGVASTLLAKDIEELTPYVGVGPIYRGKSLSRLELAYSLGKSVLLEGTQGSGLSIFHGPYPFVTSRDTNVAGCLAEAGIPPSRVRRILLVTRSTPIRVANPEPPVSDDAATDKLLHEVSLAEKTSGPLKHETNFSEVAQRAGLDADLLKRNEITSTTRRDRRVGWFEWDQFRDACSINGPTDIVLTFSDYIDAKNSSARRFEQLTDDTIYFIEELEQVATAPVSLITTRFPRTEQEREDRRSIIDRRSWQTKRAKQKFGVIDPFSSETHVVAEFEGLRARVDRMRNFFD